MGIIHNKRIDGTKDLILNLLFNSDRIPNTPIPIHIEKAKKLPTHA